MEKSFQENYGKHYVFMTRIVRSKKSTYGQFYGESRTVIKRAFDAYRAAISFDDLEKLMGLAQN